MKEILDIYNHRLQIANEEIELLKPDTDIDDTDIDNLVRYTALVTMKECLLVFIDTLEHIEQEYYALNN